MGDVVVVQGEFIKSAGALTWWELSGQTDLGVLTEAWEDAAVGEDYLVKQTTPCAALGQAVNERCHERHLLARPLPGGSAWALVKESVEGIGRGAELSHETGLRAWIDDSTMNVLVLDPEMAATSDALAESYQKMLSSIAVGPMGGWLVRLATTLCSGVAMRRCGGFYYIPPEHLGLWRDVTDAVGESGDHLFHFAPVMRSEELIQSVSHAVEREAADLIRAIREDMKGDVELGKRALRTRRARVATMRTKLAGYRSLVGGALKHTEAGVDELEMKLAKLGLLAATAEDN